MPAAAPMTTKDGRFGYEAAGDPARTPLVFLHGIGGAARAWRGQLEHFGDRFRAIAWDMPGYNGSALLPSVSIASLAEALRDFLQQLGAAKPVLVGHSIGGMIVQQLLATRPEIAGAVVLAQTSPAFGKPDGDWQKSFLDARLGPLDRGETMASLAPNLVKELVGDNPDASGMKLARDCMAAVPEATYRATMLALMGFDQRGSAEAHRGADAGAVGLEGQQCAGADDGENGELYSLGRICRARRRRTPRQSRTTRGLQRCAGSIPEGRCGRNRSDGMMTVQAGKSAKAIDGIVLDAPIFDPQRVPPQRRAGRNHRAGAPARPGGVRRPRRGL